MKRVLQTKKASELLFVGYPALPDNQALVVSIIAIVVSVH